MAVQQVKNIVATTGTYMKDGVEKKSYLTVGKLFIYDDGGMSIKLEAVPTNFDGNLSVYDRDNQTQNQNQGGQQYQQQQVKKQSAQQPKQQSMPQEYEEYDSIPF